MEDGASVSCSFFKKKSPPCLFTLPKKVGLEHSFASSYDTNPTKMHHYFRGKSPKKWPATCEHEKKQLSIILVGIKGLESPCFAGAFVPKNPSSPSQNGTGTKYLAFRRWLYTSIPQSSSDTVIGSLGFCLASFFSLTHAFGFEPRIARSIQEIPVAMCRMGYLPYLRQRIRRKTRGSSWKR